MLGVFANNHDFAFSLNDFALLANLFYRRPNFHFITSIGLFMPECYPALGQIIHRNLYSYCVALKYLDIMHTHFTGYVGSYDMTVGKLYFEHSVGEYLSHYAFEFNNIVFSQNESLR